MQFNFYLARNARHMGCAPKSQSILFREVKRRRKYFFLYLDSICYGLREDRVKEINEKRKQKYCVFWCYYKVKHVFLRIVEYPIIKRRKNQRELGEKSLDDSIIEKKQNQIWRYQCKKYLQPPF